MDLTSSRTPTSSQNLGSLLALLPPGRCSSLGGTANAGRQQIAIPALQKRSSVAPLRRWPRLLQGWLGHAATTIVHHSAEEYLLSGLQHRLFQNLSIERVRFPEEERSSTIDMNMFVRRSTGAQRSARSKECKVKSDATRPAVAEKSSFHGSVPCIQLSNACFGNQRIFFLAGLGSPSRGRLRTAMRTPRAILRHSSVASLKTARVEDSTTASSGALRCNDVHSTLILPYTVIARLAFAQSFLFNGNPVSSSQNHVVFDVL